MEDLLQTQIQDSCRLALPNGLRELMSDISREVLRAQPQDLLKFITDYLSTLMVTRENLTIAARVCNSIGDCDCTPELEDELRYIGLEEDSASDAKDIIENFLRKGEVNEGNLLLKLVKKASIDEDQLPAVLTAIRRALLRHQRNHTRIYESSSSSDDDEITKAAKHTLGLYRKTDPSLETFHCMARKIQAAYRAYKVRRNISLKNAKTRQLETLSKTAILEIKSKVTFGSLDYTKPIENTYSDIMSRDSDLIMMETAGSRRLSISPISSTSLAGSYLSLPKYRPYSPHNIETLADLEEVPEKEHTAFDYTEENFNGEDIDNVDMVKENGGKNENKLFNEFSTEEEVFEEEDKFKAAVVEMKVEEGRAEENIAEDQIEKGDDIDNDNIKEIEENNMLNEGIVEGNIKFIQIEKSENLENKYYVAKKSAEDRVEDDQGIVVKGNTEEGIIEEDIVDITLEKSQEENSEDIADKDNIPEEILEEVQWVVAKGNTEESIVEEDIVKEGTVEDNAVDEVLVEEDITDDFEDEGDDVDDEEEYLSERN